MKVLSWTVLLLSLVVLVVGSVISSSGYGLAIPDWPLAQGRLVPTPLAGGIAWEFAHRVLALATGLVSLLLGAVLLKTSDTLLQRLGNALMALIVVQIVLGGLGVLQEFPWLLRVLHAALAHLFVGLAAATVAAVHADSVAAGKAVDSRNLRRVRAFTSMILLQMLAGAIVRHAETQGVMLGALMLHVVLAIGATIAGLSIALRLAAVLKGWRSRVAYLIGAGVLAQILLGITVLVQAPEPAATGQQSLSYIWHSVSHVVVGAVLLASGTALFLRLSRDSAAARPQ